MKWVVKAVFEQFGVKSKNISSLLQKHGDICENAIYYFVDKIFE